MFQVVKEKSQINLLGCWPWFSWFLLIDGSVDRRWLWQFVFFYQILTLLPRKSKVWKKSQSSSPPGWLLCGQSFHQVHLAPFYKHANILGKHAVRKSTESLTLSPGPQQVNKSHVSHHGSTYWLLRRAARCWPSCLCWCQKRRKKFSLPHRVFDSLVLIPLGMQAQHTPPHALQSVKHTRQDAVT